MQRVFKHVVVARIDRLVDNLARKRSLESLGHYIEFIEDDVSSSFVYSESGSVQGCGQSSVINSIGGVHD